MAEPEPSPRNDALRDASAATVPTDPVQDRSGDTDVQITRENESDSQSDDEQTVPIDDLFAQLTVEEGDSLATLPADQLLESSPDAAEASRRFQVTTEMADEALGDLPELDALLADSLAGLDPELAEALLAERESSLSIAEASGDAADGDGLTQAGAVDHSLEMLVNPAAAQAALEARRAQEGLVLSDEQVVRDAAPVLRQDDGTLLFEGRYRVPGSGTAADPYKISWELLTSVRRSYDPSAGRNDLPAWLEELNGKHVQLSGFVLFPVMAEASDELLLMYNQWDGCCIGIPPTPYDAIEVRLKAPPRSVPRWAVNYGTLSGRFDVDPYIVSNWLLGLYLLDAAELELAGL